MASSSKKRSPTTLPALTLTPRLPFLSAFPPPADSLIRTAKGQVNCRLVLEAYIPPRVEDGRRVRGTGLYGKVKGQTVKFRVSGGGELGEVMELVRGVVGEHGEGREQEHE